MLKSLQSWLRPPIFEGDDEKTRIARLLHTIVMLMWGVILLGLVASLVVAANKWLGLGVIAVLSVIQITVSYLIRSGRVRAASTAIAVATWLILSVTAYAYGGLYSPTVAFFVLIVLISGLSLGSVGARVGAAMVVVTTLALWVLGNVGLLPPDAPKTTPTDLVINLILSAVMVSGLLSLMVRNLNAAADKARQNAQAQADSNRELQAIRESLETRVSERTAELKAGAEVGRALTAILNEHDLAQQAVELIRSRFGFYFTALYLADEDNQFAVLSEATGEAGQQWKERGLRLEITGQSLVSEAISTSRVRISQDVDREGRRLAYPLLNATRSEIALPLVVGSQVIGALDIQSDQVHGFDEDFANVLLGVADQLAVSLSNAKQYEAAQLDARQSLALFEASQVTGLLGESIEISINRLFGVVAQRADFDTWLAVQFMPEHRTYTVLTAYDANDPAPLEDVGQMLNIDRAAPTPSALALLSRETVIIDDPEQDDRLQHMAFEDRIRLGKLVCAPAISGDRLVGAISLGRTPDKQNINARDVQLARAIASQLAMVVTNRTLYEQAQTSAAELNQLMRLYTRQGWEGYTRARMEDVVTEEYRRPDAPPLDPIVIDQVEAAARAGEITPIDYDGQAVIGVPITLRGEVLGTLQVQDEKERAWTDEELATLKAVADQLAQSLEAARLLEESQANLQETSTLYEVSRELSAAPSLNDALQVFVRTIHSRMQADQVALVIFNEARGYGTIVAEAVPSTDGSSIHIPMQGNPSYEVLAQAGHPLVIYDVAHDPVMSELVELMTSRGVKSMLLVPLIVNNKLVGSFGVDSHQSQRHFTEQEVAFCETLARQAANTIERYRLFEQTQQNLRETMSLYQASRGIAAAQTTHEILRAVAEASASPRIDRCLLLMIDPDSPPTSPQIELSAVWERSVEHPLSAGIRWQAAQVPMIGHYSTEPLTITDVEQATDIDAAARYFYRNSLGLKSASIVRMTAAGKSLGWLIIGSTRTAYEFSAQEVQRYRTLAGQAMVALENRRLFQDVEARVNELTVLTRIGRRLASTLNLEEIMSLVVEESIGVTSATQGSIALYNEAEKALETRVVRGYSALTEIETIGELIRPDQGLRGRMLRTGEAVLVDDVRLDPDYHTIDPSTRSVYIAPIRQGELLLGALNLESPRPYAFSESDVRLIEALADQVAVAITNARAYEAEREAVERIREADRLKTQFLANMSHELRTPLNSIIGFSRVILRGIDGPLTELQQTDLTSIYNSGQHLLSLINNILDLSKIEAGKMELSIEPVNLPDIAKSVMSTAIALVKDKPVKLVQEVPTDLPTVMADQTRVRQIMLNLVSNAAKFTEKGAITLRVVPYPKELYISVTDTGIGIPQDKQEHIFEEFTQVDASTTRRYGGTGLGLAITRKFVEMHRGRIWVESQEGVGSTFTFTLPREQPIDEPEPTVSLPSDLEARGEGKKLILCIDDDPGVITLYKRYLEKQGYLVIGLTDPAKAVDEAKRLLPFAITLDVLMPNRDGWQVLAELKKTPEIASTPILVCSIIQDKTKGFSLGAVDYLVKPITENELLNALDRVNRTKAIHKILAVDDEPDALNLLRRMLETQPQIEILMAPGGAQALAAVQNDKPDLILLDLMMPDIDGFAVLDNIKGSTLTRNIPVIIVTAKELTAEDQARLTGKTVALFNKGMFTAEELLTDIVTALESLSAEVVRVQ